MSTTWIRAGIMTVADILTPEGIVSFQSVCKLTGEVSNRVLQYNVIHAAVHYRLRDFDNEALNVKLTDVSLFHGQKIYTVSNFRENIVEMKNAEPCSIVVKTTTTKQQQHGC